MLDSIDLTGISLYPGARGQLLSDGAILYTCIPSSETTSSLAAFDLDTNKMLWKEQLSGEATNLIKQGDMLVIPVSSINQGLSIDVWKIGAGSFNKTKQLWTRQITMNPPNLAVDSTHVYLQSSNGALMALDLTTGKEVWKQQFAPYKVHDYRGSDFETLHDLYPQMTLTTTRDVLYVNDGGGLVTALDPATGKELWNKRISQVVWNKTSVDNMFVFHPVAKGFFVIASDGKVDLWN